MAEHSYGTSDRDIARYRNKAEECRRQADNSLNSLDKNSWLRLAEDWMKMAQKAERLRDKLVQAGSEL